MESILLLRISAKSLPSVFAFVTVLGLSATAEAQDNACLIEGMVNKEEVKDCMQNNGGIPADQFKQSCAGLAGMGAAKLTYLPACPAQSQGVCEGFLNPAISAHYYKRGASSIPELRKSCAALGGKWK